MHAIVQNCLLSQLSYLGQTYSHKHSSEGRVACEFDFVVTSTKLTNWAGWSTVIDLLIGSSLSNYTGLDNL